jgi:hypothetical protein
VVAHVDNLLGLDVLMHARSPLSRAAIPAVAQANLNEAKRHLEWIVDNNEKERHAPTKLATMTTIKDDALQNMTEIVQNMHRLVAIRQV